MSLENVCVNLNKHWEHLGKMVQDRIERVDLQELLTILHEKYEGTLGM